MTQLPMWPHFEQDEIDAVTAVLKSGKVNYWTGGEVKAFESEYAQSLGVSHAIAVSNGTVALELALVALGISEGDEVIVAPRTFMATASAVIMRGAVPVFADVDINSGNITAETIKPHITSKTKAIIPVHIGGLMCDMDPIMELAGAHNLYIIEDCAQAHGAFYKGKPAGSIGHINIFSFCQDKIITTGGEGGLVVTNDETLWKKAWAFKDHGKNYDTVFNQSHPPGFRWLHEGPGTNWRMTEMQAAIGRKHLAKLPGWIEKRERNGRYMMDALSQLPNLSFLTCDETIFKNSFYKLYGFIDYDACKPGTTQQQIIKAINDQKAPCYSGTCCEIYLEKAFDGNPGNPDERFKNAKWLTEHSLMWLIHPTLEPEHLDHVIRATQTALQAVSKD